MRGREEERSNRKLLLLRKTYKRFAIAFKLEYKFMYVIRSVLDKYKVDFSSALSYNLRVFDINNNSNNKKKEIKTIAKLITNEKLPGIRRKIVRSALSLFMVKSIKNEFIVGMTTTLKNGKNLQRNFFSFLEKVKKKSIKSSFLSPLLRHKFLSHREQSFFFSYNFPRKFNL